jgi:GntR family transcriptional regulator/MocR family aminotransferase
MTTKLGSVRTAAPGIVPAITVDRAAAKPLYLQICDAYREAVVERRLGAGQRLPSTRTLARALKISRIPVLQAFEQLVAEGYFRARPGSGTFVSDTLPAPATLPRRAPARADAGVQAPRPSPVAKEPWLGGVGAFRMSEPSLDAFPFRTWSRLVSRHARTLGRAAMGYGAVLGDPGLREALAAYLRTARGVRCDAGQIMIVSGSQQGIAIAARVLLGDRSPVWAEEPGYGGARAALAMAGARLVPVPVDDDGLDVAAGIAKCRRARAAYVTPSHQYPLGATMSAARRLQLLDWAHATGAWIIEDDYDSEYRYESQPVAALQGLERDARVVHVGTFSKVLFPALRVGYVVIPSALVGRFVDVRRAIDVCPPALPAAALTDFIEEGHFARHLRRTSQLYRERRAALVQSLGRGLPQLQVVGSAAGMYLVALCDRPADRAIAERAARDGLWVMPLSSCYMAKPRRNGLVLGYGGTSAGAIPAAVERLRRVIASA